ncbi:purine-nucleoside phosphorylase [Rhodovulum sp. DZ06]|uniref:purine-nucleoside phosphorylase n=1 Tax=Rhodovulum sp. DZ06 TaxID=3425126 RepID=UPI003D34486F
MLPDQSARLSAAWEAVAPRIGDPVEVALVLGSGLGQLAEAVEDPVFVPYGEIPDFPVSTAPMHEGRFVIGRLHGRRVALMQGRVHLYEGWSAQDIALPVRLMRRMGADALVATNAAGALDPALKPGVPMLIEDHLNFTGVNPLTGPNDDALGPRFPDMSRAWDPDLRALALAAADAAGEDLPSGIYCGIAGPSLETSAERRWMRSIGAHAVGMSTVLEAVTAVHCGMRCVGLSAITNAADGGPEQQPDTIEEVLENAAHAGRRIAAILAELLPKLP